jgi:LEA14-like dessication related protein
VTVLGASVVGVADVIGHGSIVVSEPALEKLKARVGEVARGGGEATGGEGER